MDEDHGPQSIKQRKIAFANSEHSSVMIEILKDCIEQNPLVAETEWKTIVNTIKLDTTSTLLRRVVDYLDEIRRGSLH